jgi:chorismate mutase/prephenate dehydratase
MNFEDLRQKIDDIDARVVALIGERIKIAEEIGKGKKEQNRLIEDQERELRVLKNVRSIAQDRNINQTDIENIYRQIMDACKNIQGVAVAFQGKVGAYSEEAAIRFFGASTQTQPYESLEEVFKVVETGATPFGVVPIENSLEGSISRVYDLMLDSAVMICGEQDIRISHCLIAGPNIGLDAVRRVYSHPQALAQCRNFLSHLNCELIPASDTAGSVAMIKDLGLTDSAAIASARAAEFYGMKIIAREIEDNKHNYTRFFILSREDSLPSGDDKTSIVCSVKHEPGTLYKSLKAFAARDINLTKVESRPTRQRPWEYNFYLEFSGHRQDGLVSEALKELEDTSIFVKVLGSYPRAK